MKFSAIIRVYRDDDTSFNEKTEIEATDFVEAAQEAQTQADSYTWEYGNDGGEVIALRSN